MEERCNQGRGGDKSSVQLHPEATHNFMMLLGGWDNKLMQWMRIRVWDTARN
jgi:hypothetical protein